MKKKIAKKTTMPRTEAEWCAYRCRISCKIGREAIEGKCKLPDGITAIEYAIYNLLHAIEELAGIERERITKP